MSPTAELFPLEDKVVRRRTRRDPQPHFKADRSRQLDVLLGSPDEQVPLGHLARQVAAVVDRLDTTIVEEGYSSMGRHGHHPKRTLRVMVYASMVGLHHSTKIAHAAQTDAALLWLSGGHRISSSVLRKFRQRNAALFASAIDETVRLAMERGLISLDGIAVDSMRLRAHASTRAVRTVVRSKKRRDQLARVDVTMLSSEDRTVHDGKVEKHRAALALCAARGRASVVLTNESAALMKFPNGAGMPGHRITVAAAGVQERIIISVLVDDATNDFGKLRGAVEDAHAALQRAGLPAEAHIGVVADAGYTAESDYAFAEEAKPWADVLIASTSSTTDHAGEGKKQKYFGHERFTLREDDSVLCPANRLMRGPFDDHSGRTKWVGDGCATCDLKPQCTKSRKRAFTASLGRERIRDRMKTRLETPEGKARYGRRLATVEPVFASIEDAMAFRRASSRHSASILAEVLLKVLAHNVSRLLTAARLLRVRCLLTVDGTLVPV